MSKYKDRIESGLCGICGCKNNDGGYSCSTCRLKKNEKRKESRLTNKNKCQSCCAEIIIGKTCEKCLKRQSVRRKELYELRKKNELCVRCCVKTDKIYCDECSKIKRLKIRAKKYLGNKNKWKQLETLFNRQNGLCYYSGLPLTLGLDAHLDRKIPRSKGGLNEISNLQWVNKDVNLMKRALLEEEFLKLCEAITNNWK